MPEEKQRRSRDEGATLAEVTDAYYESQKRRVRSMNDQIKRFAPTPVSARFLLDNRKFTRRVDELVELRNLLTDNRAGVIAGIHGLGGIGKTELAYTFAHAYASVSPVGRFVVPCEFQADLRQA